MSNSMYIIIWVLVFVGIFYFLLVRPQRRQRTAQTELEHMLKKGDEVLTRAGMYGTITKVADDWVEIEVAKRTRVRFVKGAIGSITSISEYEDEDEEPIEVEEEDVETEETEDEEWVEEEGEGDEEYEEVAEDEGAEEEEAPEAPTPPPAPKV